MLQSFVTTGPHLQGMVGDSRAKVLGNYFFIVPVVQGKCQGFDIVYGPYPREIFYCEGQGKEHSFDLQFVPWQWGL